MWGLEETLLQNKSPEPVDWTYPCLGLDICSREGWDSWHHFAHYLLAHLGNDPPTYLPSRAPKRQAAGTSSPKPDLTLSLGVNNVANFDNSAGYLLTTRYIPSNVLRLRRNASQVCRVLWVLLSQKRALCPRFYFFLLNEVEAVVEQMTFRATLFSMQKQHNNQKFICWR